ncbi:transmembrane protein, putative [Medicago truncatula]|uniref:Transmembrane protein, putative n=1 Tax=Medicago truncatula TaxID=3880 RepID=G7JLJ8_MEDTR|nr:transmembrane protein, putative [Medicago truncatula]
MTTNLPETRKHMYVKSKSLSSKVADERVLELFVNLQLKLFIFALTQFMFFVQALPLRTN